MLDQHAMIDTTVLNRVVNLADLNRMDTVLEIGGGAGALTDYLLRIAKAVYVIEKDTKYVDVVEKKFGHHKKVMYIFNNAMQVDFPEFTKCVSNLPYTLCEPLLWKFTRYDYELLVFVVPKKFTKLLTGEKLSRLKLLIDAFYEVEVFDDIPPEAFDPPPKVMSSIIRLKKKEEGNLFLREFFSQYDKKVKNALMNILIKMDMNKKDAKDQVSLSIRPKIAEKRIVNLSLPEIKEVIRGFLGE